MNRMHSFMRRLVGVMGALCLLAAWAGGSGAAAGSEEDVKSVNALLDRLQQASVKHDIDDFGDCFSNLGTLFVIPPMSGLMSQPMFVTKPQMMALVPTQWSNLKSATFTDRNISASGGLAGIRTLATVELVDGRFIQQRLFLDAIDEGRTWRICLAMPLVAEPTVFVGRVVPDGAGAKAGIQEGDRLKTYGDTGIMTVPQLVDAVKAKANAGGEVPVTVLRDGKEIQLNVAAGTMNIHVEDCLLPIDKGTLIGADREDAVKTREKGRFAAFAAADYGQLSAFINPTVFLGLVPGTNGGAPRLYAEVDYKSRLSGIVRDWAQGFDPSTAKVTAVRAIEKSDIAVVASDFTATAGNSTKKYQTRLQIYVKSQGEWVWTASLPHALEIGPPSQEDTAPAEPAAPSGSPGATQSSPPTAQPESGGTAATQSPSPPSGNGATPPPAGTDTPKPKEATKAPPPPSSPPPPATAAASGQTGGTNTPSAGTANKKPAPSVFADDDPPPSAPSPATPSPNTAPKSAPQPATPPTPSQSPSASPSMVLKPLPGEAADSNAPVVPLADADIPSAWKQGGAGYTSVPPYRGPKTPPKAKEDPSYGGIGAWLKPAPGGALVARLMPGGPAETVGIRVGETIVQVNSLPLANMTWKEIVDDYLKGPVGSQVTLTLRDEIDMTRRITVTRGRINPDQSRQASPPQSDAPKKKWQPADPEKTAPVPTMTPLSDMPPPSPAHSSGCSRCDR